MADDFFATFSADNDPQFDEENDNNGDADIFGTGQTFGFTFDEDAKNEYSSSFSRDSSSLSIESIFYSEGFRPAGFQSAAVSPIDPKAFNSMNMKRFGSHQRLHNFSFMTPQPVPIAKRGITPLPSKLCTAAMEKFKPRKNQKKIEMWHSSSVYGAATDELFYQLLISPSFTINPTACGFIPSLFWPNKEFTFADIVFDSFQRKNNINCRFIHKLYNAIQFTKMYPIYTEMIGVSFITTNVLKVNKHCFARLLNIKSIDGGLFHGQGNFPSIGFKELTKEEAEVYCDGVNIDDVNYDDIRLLVHTKGMFTANWDENVVFRVINSLK